MGYRTQFQNLNQSFASRVACALALTTALVAVAPIATLCWPITVAAEQISGSSRITNETLAQEIGSRITRVPEFNFIRGEAKRLGVRAYLFGGTAAGFAHYVNWDMKREGGDTRFQPDRFDYDYTDIYRSTQDLDIVLDGPPEKAQELQNKLAQNFPHLQGNKSAWEVRLLRTDMGDKQALLNNPEFLNQHTDSNSTGMIEITEPQGGDPVVRDLRDWDSKDPYFLRDVREGKLHYYFSPKHAQTKFAQEGRNPPILSVIRFLTKAFQYELEIRPEDLAAIKKVIDEFNPHGPDLKNSYVRNWLLNKDNGRKLIQNAVNIEYAWNTLEKLGLRQKLIAIENDPQRQGSLAWWMSKEPLRSNPVGVDTSGKHPTVRELMEKGILPKDLTVAHETNSFLAHESITRAHTGDPNVLISRGGISGEAAAFGNGFYTQIGREGARGTGITIRFTVDPNAREGIDFTRSGSFLVFQNKNALKVVPESLKLTPVEYFAFLAHGEQIDLSDRAIFEKLRRKMTAARGALTDDDYRQLRSFVEESINNSEINEALIQEWVSLPKSAQWSEGLFDPLIKSELYDVQLSDLVFSKPGFTQLKSARAVNESAEQLRKDFKAIHPPTRRDAMLHLIGSDKKKAIKMASIFLDNADAGTIYVVSDKLLPSVHNEAFAIKTIQTIERITSYSDGGNRAEAFNNIIQSVFSLPHAKNWKNAQAALIDRATHASVLLNMVNKILARPESSSESIATKTMQRLSAITSHSGPDARSPTQKDIIQNVLSQPFAQKWNKARSEFLQQSLDLETMNLYFEKILKRPDLGDEPLLIEYIQKLTSMRSSYHALNIGPTLNNIVKDILSQPAAKNWKNARRKVIGLDMNMDLLELIVRHTLQDPDSLDVRTADELLDKFNSLRNYSDADKSQAFFEKTAALVQNKPISEEWDRVRLKLLASHPDHSASHSLISSLEKAHAHDSFIAKLVAEENPQTDSALRALLSRSSVLRNDSRWLEEYLKRKELDEPLFGAVLDHPRFAQDVNAMETLIKRVPKHSQDPRSGIVLTTQTEITLTKKLFSDSFWRKSPSTIELMAKFYPHSSHILESILAHPDLNQHPEWLEPILKSGSRRTDVQLMQELSKPERQLHTKWLKILIQHGSLRDEDAKKLLALPHWKNHPELIQFCGGYAPTLKCLQKGAPAPSISACVLGSIKRIFGK